MKHQLLGLLFLNSLIPPHKGLERSQIIKDLFKEVGLIMREERSYCLQTGLIEIEKIKVGDSKYG